MESSQRQDPAYTPHTTPPSHHPIHYPHPRHQRWIVSRGGRRDEHGNSGEPTRLSDIKRSLRNRSAAAILPRWQHLPTHVRQLAPAAAAGPLYTINLTNLSDLPLADGRAVLQHGEQRLPLQGFEPCRKRL